MNMEKNEETERVMDDFDVEVAWCWACQRYVLVTQITIDHRHDEDKGGCGCYIR